MVGDRGQGGAFPAGRTSMAAGDRKFRRVIVGPEFAVSFVLGEESFSKVRLANVSEGGCLALVPGERSGGFFVGAELEELTLMHELLPTTALEARVAYAFGAGELDVVGIGIQFVSMSAGLRQSLRDFVDSLPVEP
jgi:c-di-GMP-binding flagellar brake protein YcgR